MDGSAAAGASVQQPLRPASAVSLGVGRFELPREGKGSRKKRLKEGDAPQVGVGDPRAAKPSSNLRHVVDKAEGGGVVDKLRRREVTPSPGGEQASGRVDPCGVTFMAAERNGRAERVRVDQTGKV